MRPGLSARSCGLLWRYFLLADEMRRVWILYLNPFLDWIPDQVGDRSRMTEGKKQILLLRRHHGASSGPHQMRPLEKQWHGMWRFTCFTSPHPSRSFGYASFGFAQDRQDKQRRGKTGREWF